jgi:hypothetical protein
VAWIQLTPAKEMPKGAHDLACKVQKRDDKHYS